MEILEEVNIFEFFTAAMVFVIGLMQWRLQNLQRRENLFDRRWEYYISAKEKFLDELVREIDGKASSSVDKCLKNWVEHHADEALLLFGKDIEAYIRSNVPDILRQTGGTSNENKVIEDPVTSFRRPFEKYMQVSQ